MRTGPPAPGHVPFDTLWMLVPALALLLIVASRVLAPHATVTVTERGAAEASRARVAAAQR